MNTRRAIVLIVVLAAAVGGLVWPASAVNTGLLRGEITGTVTNDAGQALSNICVDVFDTNDAWQDYALTDQSGHYAIALPGGEYKVAFADCNWPPKYLAEWYDDKADFQSADVVGVTELQETSGIDAVLAL